MSVYFIGDLHLDHKNICSFRTQFSTVEEHNEIIVDNILSTVGKRDKLILMGDICFSVDSLKYLQKIKEHAGVIQMHIGNHDLESSTRPSITQLVEIFGNRIYGMAKYKRAWLSHEPIHPDELRGLVNIHGHVHGQNITDDRYFNTSCENIDYKPISHDKIIDTFRSRGIDITKHKGTK